MAQILDVGITDPTTTRGDAIVRGASALQRLALAAANDLYSSDGTDLVSKTLSAILDAKIGSTTGQIPERGASLWGAARKNNCLLTKSVDQTISSGGAPTRLTWDTESYDNGSMHSTLSNTSRITIPTNGDGLYCVFVHVGFEPGNFGSFQDNVYIYKNGSNLFSTGFDSRSTPQTYATGDITIPLPLVAGDYIEVLVYQDSGGNKNVNQSSFFGAALMVAQ